MTIIRLVLCFSLAVRIHRGNGFVAAGVRDSIGKGFFGRYKATSHPARERATSPVPGESVPDGKAFGDIS